MSNKNEFTGYAVAPGLRVSDVSIRLDFNPSVKVEPNSVEIEEYNIRMFLLRDSMGSEEVEVGVSLTEKQWLELIESMKSQVDLAKETKTRFEKLQ